jgi:hypothetical protein
VDRGSHRLGRKVGVLSTIGAVSVLQPRLGCLLASNSARSKSPRMPMQTRKPGANSGVQILRMVLLPCGIEATLRRLVHLGFQF